MLGGFVQTCGAKPVPVPIRAKEGYRIDVAAVRVALAARTRTIVVGSPANPTAAVQHEGTLRELASLGPTWVSNGIYDGLVYDGAEVTSALQVTEQAFVLDGFSKRVAMTRFRLGYVIVPPGALRKLDFGVPASPLGRSMYSPTRARSIPTRVGGRFASSSRHTWR